MQTKNNRWDSIKRKLKGEIPALLFVSLLALIYGGAFIFADFYKMPYSGLSDFCTLFAQWLIITFAAFALLYLLSIQRVVFAVIFPVLTTLCTILAYFRYTAHISFSATAIDLAFVNDTRTSLEVVTPVLIGLVVFSLLLSAAMVYVRWRYIRFNKWYYHAFVALVLLFALLTPHKLSRPILARMPYNIFDAFATYFEEQREVAVERPPFGGIVTCPADSLDVILIIGETVRAKNLGINGYERSTTPYLSQEANVVSLPNVYSEYGFTHTSVPYMLTRADRQHPNRAYSERSFISLFNSAGYQTCWIANQEAVDTYRYFMGEVDSLHYANRGKSVYSYSEWLDEDVLPFLDATLSLAAPKNLILIHTVGSHWWYNAHFTPAYAHWQPLIKSRIFSSNTLEELVNSYDNTILYSDYIWHSIIDRVRAKNAIVLYLSDHAENLGEGGLYGHGEDHEALHYPGCWIWYSDKYYQTYPEKIEALRQQATRGYNSAFLFHSILSAGSVTTPYYQAKFDVFTPHTN